MIPTAVTGIWGCREFILHDGTFRDRTTERKRLQEIRRASLAHDMEGYIGLGRINQTGRVLDL